MLFRSECIAGDIEMMWLAVTAVAPSDKVPEPSVGKVKAMLPPFATLRLLPGCMLVTVACHVIGATVGCNHV